MKKNTLKKLALALSIVSVASVSVGCQPDKTPDTVDTLEIYVQDLGYGIEWLRDEIALFKEQAWVKEKYPNLVVPDFEYNSIYGYADGLIKNPSATTVDLFFTSANYGLEGAKDSSGNYYLADLNDVFNDKVPGEDILYKDKMLPSHEKMSKHGDTYWSSKWTSTFSGILYNNDIMENLGLSVPRTTDELVKVCADVKALEGKNTAYDKNYSIMMSTQRTEAYYWQYMAFPTWWAQYQGVESYYDFYRGIADETANNKDVMKQRGRLESMKVLEQLLGNYAFIGAGSIDFIEAQTRFLMGDGLFMINGDWFYNEMKTTVEGLKERGYDYDIRFMKYPVISSIVEKTPSIKTLATQQGKTSDAMLSEIVEAIDNGETSFDGISQADFDKVKEARGVINGGYLHKAYVPYTATGKEVAKDFLRFLATDAGLEQYMRTTKGAALPFKYDVKAKNEELYNTFWNIEKYRADIFASNPTVLLSSDYEEFVLAYKGGLKAVPIHSIDPTFLTKAKTAQAMFDDQAAYYTEGVWDDVLSNAGVK